ncbi:hypothetical protein TIFTF001_011555 [Ficus carica]|uniref:Uncharacterized protein n=1 Tax=Ficus carica TaxID=3494 RepID=A0AA87ZYG2_FICCA|nr:hypothetical protein TIFTF001_011555 [Ficus carica]
MALLKKVLVLLLLLAATAIADARSNLLKLQTTKNVAYFLSQPGQQEECKWPSCCNDCECKEEAGKTQCECFDLKIYGVPPTCKSAVCVLMEPTYCRCLDITDSCDYPKCFLE